MAVHKGMENLRPRASSYKPEYAELARNYALLGATIEEIGPLLGVTGRTIKNWKKAHPEFAEAIAIGNKHADAKVIGRAFERCVEGDSTMLIFWLKNRMGWRDRRDTQLSGPGGEPLTVQIVRFGEVDEDPPAE
ncbi:hypothetical protein [Burkholderia mayonis]|nr:hypothetical protein [Burkholderia mayonis]